MLLFLHPQTKVAVYDFPSISELTVLRSLQHLPGNKSTAHPLLTNLVLKECAPFLTPSVSYIFNLSVTTGVFPAVWKQATVVPLHKNRGKAEDPSNYRPVSLLPALGKALDKMCTTGLTPRPGPVHYFHQQPDTHCMFPNRHLRGWHHPASWALS